MMKFKKIINKLTRRQRIIIIFSISIFILLSIFALPSLARYKNRSSIINIPEWNGSVANSYHSGNGTIDNPYVIFNGSELAYFCTQLETTDYEGKYFELSNDIILNKGIFNYDNENGIQYILDGQTYYVDDYSNKYYDNVNHEGIEVGILNTFDSLNGFKGTFNGDSHSIYGLYMTSNDSVDLALFTNLKGSVSNIYIENSMVYGGVKTAILASNATNSILSNILVDGVVVGKGENLSHTDDILIEEKSITVENSEITDYLNWNSVPEVGSSNTTTSITGVLNIDGNASIKINGIDVFSGAFNIDLGTSILNNVSIVVDGNGTVNITDISYNITTEQGISGGVLAISSNTTISNVINKASVYGYSSSGGLVGVTTDHVDVSNSYNIGSISGQIISGGLVGTIEKSENDINIVSSYNNGSITGNTIGGIIGNINSNNGTINIDKVFNTSDTNYNIGVINSSSVDIRNSYYTNGLSSIQSGSTNGYFINTNINNLKDKTFMMNLGFNEFINSDDLLNNPQNMWIYEVDKLPILFIDDITKPIVGIVTNNYTWNTLSYDLNEFRVTNDISLSINDLDEQRPIKEKYYYISDKVLTPTEVNEISSWITYDSIIQLEEEGYYVIYVKVVDYRENNNTTIINTDLIHIDLMDVIVNDVSWSKLRMDLDNIYVNQDTEVTVEVSDSASEVKYYIDDKVLSSIRLDDINDSAWQTYTGPIIISDIGKHIVYVKELAEDGSITYVNTDYIVLDGYNANSLTIGNGSNLNDNNITSKSNVSLRFSYTGQTNELTGYKHNLVSSILFPEGTKLTLVDYINNKVYQYKITTSNDIYDYNNSCPNEDLNCNKIATYPLTLFKEVGKIDGDTYQEQTYDNDGTVNENFGISIDYSDSNMVSNYSDVKNYLALTDSNDHIVRSTLYSTIKNYNIYYLIDGVSSDASLSLSSNYNGNPININSDSTTNIDITSIINYKNINEKKIVDTRYDNMQMGLIIKMVDSSNNIVDRDYYKNIVFKIGDKQYYPERDSIIHINLENGLLDTNKTIEITTYENNNTLPEGTYYFQVSNFVSYDGMYANEIGTDIISIPINLEDEDINVSYDFDVNMNDNDRIISRTESSMLIPFKILYKGQLRHPRITVALYKKDEITAYNQNYSRINLADYSSDMLNLYLNNNYYVTTSPVRYNGNDNSYNSFNLNFIPSSLEKTGYKFVFELYDDSRKIGSIDKYFIVK